MTQSTSTDRSAVTVIGLGLMGAALANALVDAGHPTTVWNRTPESADPLVAAGAIRADTVADAVSASPLTIACLLDDHAVHKVLGPIADHLDGRALANLTSGTPDEARATAEWAAAHGIDYLDGKILAFPSTVGTSEAFLLYSGSEDAFARLEPSLAPLGSAVYLGPDPGLASLYDLGLLDVMYGTMTGYLHALALLGAEGIGARSFLPYATDLLGILPAYIADLADQIERREFGNREAKLDMQAVYLEHMVEASDARGVDPTFPAYVKGLMERAITSGHGRDDVGRLLAEISAPARAAG